MSLIAAALLASAATASLPRILATEEACRAYREDVFCSGPGVVWCSKDGTLGQADLARAAAPILWFSPDEPLLPRLTAGGARDDGTRHVPLPQPLRVIDPRLGAALTDDPEAGAVVYWRVTDVLARRDQQKAVDEALSRNQLLLSGIRTLTLAYFFYYERDEGLNPHYNDLEGVDLQIEFGAEAASGRRNAAITRVTGQAHGSELQRNHLQIGKSIRSGAGAPDAALPITIFVEEGKHASAPDRNGDGTYTPGYDINLKVPDAWGVRDVFGSGVVSSHYRESMTKPRRPSERVGPDRLWFLDPADPGTPLRGGLRSPAQCYATAAGLYLPDQAYRLEPAPVCAGADQDTAFCRDVRKLRDLEKGKNFYSAPCLGGRVEAMQVAQAPPGHPKTCNFLSMDHAQQAFGVLRKTRFPLKYLYGDSWALQPVRYAAVAGRWEGRAYGPQVTVFFPFGLPKFAGWFAGRVAWVRDQGEMHFRSDISYTPSMTRMTDWYGAVGLDWGLTEGGSAPERHRRWGIEGGLQARFRAWWLRVGVRSSLSAGRLGETRVVSELGFGPLPKHARIH